MNATNDKSIYYYRKIRGIKQQELADKLGLKIYLMSYIENKKLYPNMGMAEKIAEILEVPIGHIYSKEEIELILSKGKGGKK